MFAFEVQKRRQTLRARCSSMDLSAGILSAVSGISQGIVNGHVREMHRLNGGDRGNERV